MAAAVPAIRRRAAAIALTAFLIGLAVTAPPVSAVTISQPSFAGGAVGVTVHFEDPDNIPLTNLLLHWDCSISGSITDTLALEEGASSARAILHVTADSTTTGYGYFTGYQTGYGEVAGEHGYATGDRSLAGGYGYGYGYGYASGDLALTLELRASGFEPDEVCTLVIGLDTPGLSGDFESPRSAPFTPRVTPVADAGADQNRPEGVTVQLDGSASTDADGLPGPLTYAWTQTAGAAVTLAGASTATPSFTSPTVADEEEFVFLLTVGDGLDSDTDSVTITVHHDNLPPLADAGADAEAGEGDEVTLDGTGSSDPDGDTLAFLWEQVSGPAVTLVGPTTASATFEVPELAGDSPAVFRLTVTDGVLSANDEVTITFLQRPEADLQAVPLAGNVPLDVAFSVAGSCTQAPCTASLSFGDGSPAVGDSCGQAGSGCSIAAAVQHTYSSTGTFAAVLTVTDGRGLTALDSVSILVVPEGANTPPVAHAGPDQAVPEGSQVTLDADASFDAQDGRALDFEWVQVSGPEVGLEGATTAHPTFVAPAAAVGQTLVFRVTATDQGLLSAIDTMEVAVRDAAAAATATYYLHTACDGPVPVPVSLLGESSSAQPAPASSQGLCIHPVLPVVNNADQPFAVSGSHPELPGTGATAEGTVYLSFLLPDQSHQIEGTAVPLLDGVRVDIAVRSGATTLGEQQNIRVENAHFPFGVLATVNDVAGGGEAQIPHPSSFVPVSFAFPVGALASTAPLSLDVHVAPTVAMAYVVGTAGAQASWFALEAPAAPNQRPSANAGADQSVLEGTPVTLSGLGSSDPEGAPLSYHWTQVGGMPVAISSPTAAQPTFTAPAVSSDTPLTFRLLVGDGHTTSATVDDVVVLVRNVGTTSTSTSTTGTGGPNRAPQVEAGPNLAVNEGDLVVLVGDATDPDGDLVAVTWTQVTAAGEASVPLEPLPLGHARFVAPQVNEDRILTFRLRALDSHGLSVEDTLSVTVRDILPADPGPGTGGESSSTSSSETSSSSTGTKTSASSTTTSATTTSSSGTATDGGAVPIPPGGARPGFDLSATLRVVRGPNGNLLSWSDPGFAPLGYQLWSSNSPFVMLAIRDGSNTTYEDTLGSATTQYKVTYFTGNTEGDGFFLHPEQVASLFNWVPNADDDDAGPASAGGAGVGGLSARAWTWFAVALLLVLIVVGVLLLRRHATQQDAATASGGSGTRLATDAEAARPPQAVAVAQGATVEQVSRRPPL